MRIIPFIITVLLLTCTQAVIAQQDTVQAAPSLLPKAILDITQLVEIAIDSNIPDQDTYAYMPLDSFDGNFQPTFTYWLRFTLDSSLLSPSRMLIVKSDYEGDEHYAQWDAMTIVQLDTAGNILDQQQTGVNTKRSQKRLKLAAGINAGLVTARGKVTSTFVLQLQNFYGVAQKQKVTVELRDPAIPIPASGSSTMVYVLAAIAFVLSILALFFYLFMRSRSYLFFFLYLVFLGAHYLIIHPALPFTDWFIPETPWLTPYAFFFLALGSLILFMVFGRYFMNLPALSPRTDRWLQIAIGLWVSFVIAELLLMAITKHSVLASAIFFIPITAFAFLVRFAFFKNILARIFVIGAAWLLLFTIMGLFFETPLLELGINPWPIGQVGQILIYMAGLAYQVRDNERQKAAAQRITEMDTIKSRFFANISHEFRTPLTLLRGILQQVQLNKKPDKEERIALEPRQLSTMQRNTDRLLELVNQLLDLSRLDAGSMKLNVMQGDVIHVVKSMLHAFDNMAERKQILYQIHLPEQAPIAFFDKDKLEKIVTNLLSNAFKYTPDGGRIAVEVSVHEDRMRINVADSGPGISKHELDKIFDRFYQVEGNEDKGSGIGLALVKELVTLYKGQISVSSDPGKGSQFKVSLPLDRSILDMSEVSNPEVIATSQTSVLTEHGKHAASFEKNGLLPHLLIVEDNEDLRQFIRESLQDQFQISEAVHGVDGLEKARQEIPDLIISDVMMPRMDGFTMCDKIKHDERTSHIPIILLTAKAGQTSKIEGLETGADDYLTKPFDVRELQVRTQNLIEQRKLLRQKFAGTIQIKPSEIAADSLDVQFIRKTMTAIEANMQDENFGVEELAKAVAMSRSQLHRKLIALLDKTPSDIIRQTRLLRAQELLQQRAGTPAEVAYQVGFNSHSYFTKCYKEEFGLNPSEQ